MEPSLQGCSEEYLDALRHSDMLQRYMIVIDFLDARWLVVWFLPLCPEGFYVLRFDFRQQLAPKKRNKVFLDAMRPPDRNEAASLLPKQGNSWPIP